MNQNKVLGKYHGLIPVLSKDTRDTNDTSAHWAKVEHFDTNTQFQNAIMTEYHSPLTKYHTLMMKYHTLITVSHSRSQSIYH